MNRAVSVLALGLLVLGTTSSRGETLLITSLQGNGTLTWTNSLSNAEYRIEWAPELANGATAWTSSWDHLTKIIAAGPIVTSAVPMFYRVVADQPPVFNFADYVPIDPNVFRTRVSVYTNFTSPAGSMITNKITGFDSVPYTSGRIVGTAISSGHFFYNDTLAVQFLGDSTNYLSVDTNLTAYPPDYSLGPMWNGMIITQAFYAVKRDLLEWDYSQQKMLIQVQTITVPYGTYTNAIVHWTLDLGKPYTTLDFHGSEAEMGLTLPTSEQTQGHSVTDFAIFGRDAGEIAGGDIEAISGNLNDLRRLVSVFME